MLCPVNPECVLEIEMVTGRKLEFDHWLKKRAAPQKGIAAVVEESEGDGTVTGTRRGRVMKMSRRQGSGKGS